LLWLRKFALKPVRKSAFQMIVRLKMLETQRKDQMARITQEKGVDGAL
jgi:hypothetical protein